MSLNFIRVQNYFLNIENTRFPLNIKLPDNLECGSKIYIHGCVAAEPNRFAINLKNAETDANNYLHFNPRFDEGVVVRNSRLDEAWGDEEREGDMPFAPGQPFLITIIPTVDNYEVIFPIPLVFIFPNKHFKSNCSG
ncbi:UNVERIFIED_CONTAM: Lgals7 [Trichonephila clavipes]